MQKRNQQQPDDDSDDTSPLCSPSVLGYDTFPIETRVSSAYASEQLGCVMSFHQLWYSVEKRVTLRRKESRFILRELSGVFRPGMNAILGPTGSGKSSLLDILAGRKNPRGLTGQVLLDGTPRPDNFKCMVGYVVQDDVIMGTLTVRENLMFSASLRLPRSLPVAERKRRVEDVIDQLGLRNCADTKVGTEMIRGVSGGERKRTNIGMELIISPKVLFLDEPTTGLDASTATSVMHILRGLSRQGRTIIFSIHQPRYSIFRLFDAILLLAEGRTVFSGPSMESLDYFRSMGYSCEEHNNPPDFFLDVITGDVPGPIVASGEQRAEALSHKYEQSEWSRRQLSECERIASCSHPSVSASVLSSAMYATSFWHQWGVVSKRCMLHLVRNPQTSVMQFVAIIIFGLVVGTIYWQVDDSLDTGLKNRVGAFFFIVMNMVFGNLSAVELFIQERPIFMHENASGFYRVSAYFLAKVLCDILPMRVLPVFLFSSITYWMIGFSRDLVKFAIYSFILLCTSLSSAGLAFCLSSSVSIFAVANLIIALCYTFMMVFGGFLVALDSIVVWLRWIKWLSIFRYSLDALSINELKDLQLCDAIGNITVCQPASVYLDDQKIAYATSWDLWQNMVALVGMTLILLFLTYIQLRRMNKFK